MPNSSDKDNVDRLRANSRAKHLILQDYLPAWFSILGTYHKTLNYFDCFSAGGKYIWKETEVAGSPVISIKSCIDLLESNRPKKPDKINLIFIDHDERQLQKLHNEIHSFGSIPNTLNIRLEKHDSETLVKQLLADGAYPEPSFFFIDPYNHPFPLDVMKKIMKRRRTEIMVNVMFYRIIMDLKNPSKIGLCRRLFDPDQLEDVEKQVRSETGNLSADNLLNYLHGRLEAQYHIPFKVHYGPDEQVSSSRLKYLLVHYCNNLTAFNLMLSIMYKNSPKGDPLRIRIGQEGLFPVQYFVESHIRKNYLSTGKSISFDDFVSENWREFFLESHYKEVLKKLEKEGIIDIKRISSKKTGLKQRDLLIFHE